MILPDMSSIPEWLEYWIAKEDTGQYILSLMFMSLVTKILSKIRNKKSRKRIKTEAEIRFFRRN